MQRKVLESLYNQGGLTLFAISDEETLPLEALHKFALALNAGARFVVIDFTGKRPLEGNAPIQASGLSQKVLTAEELEKISTSFADDGSITFTGTKALPSSDGEFRTLYHNIKNLGKIAPHVIGIISTEQVENVGKLVSMARLLIMHVTPTSMKSAAAFIEDVKEAQKIEILWLSKERPARRSYPKARKAIKRNASATKEAFAIDFKKAPRKTRQSRPKAP